MGKRFGRNQKRKLRNEINQLKYKLAETNKYSPFETYMSDKISISRHISYSELYHHSVDPSDKVYPTMIDIDTFHRLKIKSEIRDNSGPLCHRTLLIEVGANNKRINYYIDIQYLKDLLNRGYPLDGLYKEIYGKFVEEVEKSLKDL